MSGQPAPDPPPPGDGGTPPESLLEPLNLALLNLLGALTVLDSDGDTLVDLCRVVLRHTLTAETLGQRHLIAVAGTQGTGKTTLVQQLYGLEDGWLRANRGQGERMPVFVVEDDVDTPQGHLTVLVDDADSGKRWRTSSVDKGQWMHALRDDGGNVLLLELRVPRRLFPDAPPRTAGLLLLPGYEQRTQQNRRWQELMRQSLVGASRVLLVTHEQDMATSSPNEALEDLRKRYLDGTSPLVAITHCDAIRDEPQERDALRATAAERYEVPPEAVFCTWVGPPGDAKAGPAEPVDALRAALSDLGSGVGNNRISRLRELEQTVAGDLGELLTRAERALEAHLDLAASAGHQEVREMLREFDGAEAELRPVFERELVARIRRIRDDAIERARQMHRSDWEGWDRLRDRAVAYLKLHSSQTRDELGRMIRDAWTGNPEGRSPIAPVLPLVFASVVRQHLAEANVNTSIAWAARETVPPIGGAGPAEQDAPDPQTQAAIEVFRDVRRLATMTADHTTRPTRHLRTAVRLLPALTLEWAHLGSIYPDLVGLEHDTLEPTPDRSAADQAQELAAHWRRWNLAQREILGAWADLAGLEGGSGDIDTIQRLVAAARGGAGAAMGQAVATVVAGSLAVVVASVVTVDLINRRLVHQLGVVQAAIDKIQRLEITHRLAAYDDLMRLARRILLERLRQAYGLDTDTPRREWLRISLQRVKARRLDLLDALHGHLGALG